MNYNKYLEIFENIIKVNNEFLKNEFLSKALEYARIRTDWNFMDDETKASQDNFRTSKHNAFIDSINSISRFMAKNNQDNSWFKTLPDSNTLAGRKEWGDFACLIHCFIGIRMR